ncbi:MAG: response regulator, partial [bacterium]|nr:response regulator [bacterium]
IGMTGVLLETRLDRKQRDYVETIRVSGESLLTIINDILDFSKIESGKLDIEQAPFDLRSCIEAGIELFAPMAAEKGLEMGYRIQEDIPEVLLGDASRTRQVLVNLLSNAVKFTAAGEVFVSLSARPLGDDSSAARRWEYHFEVRDTGAGIPPGNVPALFQPFTQVDASVTRRYGGTGLGLAISKRLIELMGGSIRIESIEGEGTRAHFTLGGKVPAAEQTEPVEALAIDGDLGPRRGLRILLAEDNIVNQKVALLMLGGIGCRADLAANGLEVLEALDRESYDLVLMDVRMPEMDGIEATRRIRQRPKDRQPYIIGLTAHAMEGDRDRCLAAGMDDYLSKPIRKDELRAALQGCFPQ